MEMANVRNSTRGLPFARKSSILRLQNESWTRPDTTSGNAQFTRKHRVVCRIWRRKTGVIGRHFAPFLGLWLYFRFWPCCCFDKSRRAF